MSVAEWVAMLTLGFLMFSATIGGVVRICMRLNAIEALNVKALADHEHRDAERHVETTNRLTAIETLILQNGIARKRRAVAI